MAKSVAKNAVYSGIRTLSYMLFPLITYPYVTRVLMAESLGRIDFSISTVSYFALIAALGIATYATREGASLRESREELDRFSSEVFTINVASSLVAYALLALLVIAWPHLHGYAALIAIQSVTILGTTIGVEWLYALEEDYGYITARTVIVQAVSAIMLFVLVHKPSDYVIYASITVVSAVGGNLFNWFRSKKYATIKLVWGFDYKRHLLPMLILFGNAVAVTIYVNIDVSLLNVMRGDYEVGIYGVAVKIYRMVKQLLNAIVAVALPRFSLYVAKGDDGAYTRLLENIAHGLLITVIPALTLLYLMSPDVVLIVGGETYLESVPALRVLCIAGVFAVGANFFVNAILLPYGNERLALNSTVIGAVVNLLLNLFFIPAIGIVGAAITTAVAECLVVVSAAWYSRKDVDLAALAKGQAPVMFATIGGVVAMALCHGSISMLALPWLVSFFIRGFASIAIYALFMLLLKDSLLTGMIAGVKSRILKR